jgi:hypothetical protein
VEIRVDARNGHLVLRDGGDATLPGLVSQSLNDGTNAQGR